MNTTSSIQENLNMNSKRRSKDPVIILIRHAEKLDWLHGRKPEKGVKADYIDNHLLSSKGLERAHALVPYFLHRPEFTALFRQAPISAVYTQGVMSQDSNAASGVGEDNTMMKMMGKGRSERPKQTVMPLVQALSGGFGIVGGIGTASSSAGNSYMSDTAYPKVSLLKANATEPVPLVEFLKRDVVKMIRSLTMDLSNSATAATSNSISSPPPKRQTIIVSWSHQTLPALAVSLGVPREQVPAKWSKQRFDVTWVLKPVGTDEDDANFTEGVGDDGGDGSNGSNSGTGGRPRYKLVQLPQRLLYGDLETVIDVAGGYWGPELFDEGKNEGEDEGDED